MAHTWDELHEMTVARLREVAQEIEHDALHGYSTMHKEELIPALCDALGIEAHAHHEVVGIDKAAVKAEIRELKVKRDEAFAAGNNAEVRRARRRIHRLKGKLRRATI